MQKVTLSKLVQYQLLEMGAKLSHQTKGKLPYLTLFLKVYSRKKKIHYQILNQCVKQISAKLFFLKTVEKKLLNLDPYKSPGAVNLHPEVVKELSVSSSVPLSVLYTESFKQQKQPQYWKDAMITPLYKKDEKCLARNLSYYWNLS